MILCKLEEYTSSNDHVLTIISTLLIYDHVLILLQNPQHLPWAFLTELLIP
jgi:hypothetical protein